MNRVLSLILTLLAFTVTNAQTSPENPGAIYIPVVVHVLYNTPTQNISAEQIASQLNVLNQDYTGTNVDRSKIPSYFASLTGATSFQFRLANVDGKGNATTGIVRKFTSIQMFGTDDRIKSSAVGGDNSWDRNKYLNIWVGNLAGGVMGYSSTPGSDASKDGVVISYTAFGTMGTATAPFNLGRTATHEIGHWLNLIHIWGDSFCGDDQVDDTPKQRMANKGNPTGEKFSCEQNAHGDMYMNFMDLTSDATMKMFTAGQCKRMKALFEKGGARYAMLFSNGLSGKTMNEAPLPAELPSAPVVKIKTSVLLYPNPASSAITIELSAISEAGKKAMTIYNGIGQPLMRIDITSSKTQVNISQLKPGVYYMRMMGGGTEQTIRFTRN
jgi:hypothetical protein